MSGDADSQAAGLVGVLSRSRDFGFLGPGDVGEQIEHSRSFGHLVEGFLGARPTSFLDLGAGGGLPGLVLLAEWPDASAVLVDAQEKRCRFLVQAIEDLGWGSRARVRCGRAEVVARDPELRAGFGLVVARGFGPPPTTAECGVGFLSPGGCLAVTEPPRKDGAVSESSRWPADGLASLGFGAPRFLRSETAGAACLVLPEIAEDRWPRRDGVPGKRPLW